MSGCRDVGRSLLGKVEEASCLTGSDNLVAVLSRVRRWREVVKNGVRIGCPVGIEEGKTGGFDVSKNRLVMVGGGLTSDLRVVLAG